jgi:pyruvate kinase
VSSGMDVARINGAHDDLGTLERMAQNVRKAASEVGRSCRICVDLPGPKVRTGPLLPGPEVVRIRPERDLRGVSVVPATAYLGEVGDDVGGTDGSPVIPISPEWIARRSQGAVIRLLDTRGSRRELLVAEKGKGFVRVEAWDTTYLESGLEVNCDGDVARIGCLLPVPQFHLLMTDDRLCLTRDLEPVPPWSHGQEGMARIGCTLPAVFEVVRVGQHVVLDDGRMTGIVEKVSPTEIVVRMTAAARHGSKLRAEKGVNFPACDLPIDVVQDGDMPLLRLAAEHADMLAVSFLRTEGDVDTVQRYLTKVGGSHLGLVLKIETRSAFARLPHILLHAMGLATVGVMIARGDLAAEVGYERLAELQEEILWLCEAAHLPVIWATEVLDHLARTGMPSRAEVTDAAMAQRAECVMLNKGPYVDIAIVMLGDILHRMAGHQRKKAALLRPLQSWDGEHIAHLDDPHRDERSSSAGSDATARD